MRERKGGGRDGRKDRAREHGSKREGHIHIYTHNHIQTRVYTYGGLLLRTLPPCAQKEPHDDARTAVQYPWSVCACKTPHTQACFCAERHLVHANVYGHTKCMQANLDMHIAHCAQEISGKSVSSHVP